MALTEGIVALLLSKPVALSLAVCGLLFFIGRALESGVDGLEPPVLRSKIPMIGHFYSLLKDQEAFFKRLEWVPTSIHFSPFSSVLRAHCLGTPDAMPRSLTHTHLVSKKHHLPIATIPILRTKLYAISDPILVQSAYCNKNLSFTPFAVRGAQKIAGFSDEYHQVLMQTDVLPEYFKSLYDGTTAQHIHQLNVTSLKHVSKHIGSIEGDGMQVPNTYLWLRNLMTVATCEGLFGPENPIRGDELVEDVW